jgi:hypothetical protein
LHLPSFACSGGLYDEDYVEKRMDRAYEVEELGGKLSKMMDPSGKDDISILAMQRLFSQYVVLITFFLVHFIILL